LKQADPFKQYYPALTGFRAIAAYAVFIHHIIPKYETKIPQPIFNFFNELHVGVVFFFVLSGFLITLRYGEISFSSSKDLLRYGRNRFARIYPVYFVLIIATLLVSGNYDVKDWILNITLLKGFFDDYKFSGIAQSWSLTVEESFYFLAPFIFYITTKKVPFLLQLLFWHAIGVVLVVIFHGINFHSLFDSYTFMLHFTFFGLCFNFYCGIYLAKKINSVRGDQPMVTGRKSGFPRTYFFLFLLILSVVVMSCLRTSVYKFGILHPVGRIINFIILPPLTAAFFYFLINEASFLRTLLSSKFFISLGKSSYIFYLIHMGIVYTFLLNYVSENIVLIFLGLIILSLLLYFLFEEPVNAFLRSQREYNQSYHQT